MRYDLLHSSLWRQGGFWLLNRFRSQVGDGRLMERARSWKD